MMRAPLAIEPELTFTGERFETGIRLEVDADGRFARVAPSVPADHGGANTIIERWRGRAVIPGFINSHSHAFQRGLRGRGESFPAGAGSFWSWREAMYGLVAGLTPAALHALTARCFREMLAAGITTVGEFHYVHRTADGRWAEMDDAIISAAAEVGIRLVLLQCAYRTGGFDRPLAGGQTRFDTASLDAYIAQYERLLPLLDPATQSIAVTAHSVRAVPWNEIVALKAESVRRGTVFHMHVEEVIPEIEECLRVHGRRPMQMIVEDLGVDDRMVAVHCTHTDSGDLDRYLEAGGTVCICPLTEGNLGDGVPDTPRMMSAGRRAAASGGGGSIAIGSDLNSRLCVFEELRWMEYLQRLVRRERGALRRPEPDASMPGRVAPALLETATVNGARALGVNAGRIATGAHADFSVIDLEHPTLEGFAPETLSESLIFGAGNAVIAETWVNGRRVWERDGS